jgi:hypothetical protein
MKHAEQAIAVELGSVITKRVQDGLTVLDDAFVDVGWDPVRRSELTVGWIR